MASQLGESRAFNQCGKTIVVAAATSAPLGVQALSDGSGSPGGQYRVFNSGSETVHLGFGTSDTTAQTNAAIPSGTGANAKFSIPIPAGCVEVLTYSGTAYFSGITVSGNVSLFITPGRGI